ncbi:MAG: gephyrin-like molybdotransferase Glp [Gallionella sp.]
MKYLTVTDAQACILEVVKTLGIEMVGIERCLGRVLAADILANRDQPPYDVSAMDGFALRSADLAHGAATLEIVEDIRAGEMPTKILAAGQCARIMTGAPVPQGADAVIRVEDTEALSDNQTKILCAVKPGNDIRQRAESMRNGAVVLTAGTEITPGVIGMLAMVKCGNVAVYRQPRVAILSTGDELEGLNDPFDANKIPDANSYALMAQVQALGISPVMLGIARDDPDELRRYLQQGLEYDVLLVSGGTSVGVHDYVRPTLEALGVEMKFWRVAMKPGHPMAFGVASGHGSGAFVFGLPGNPVSSMVCFEQFVAPALRRMTGKAKLYRRTVEARLARDVKHQPGRTEFIRVTLHKEESGYAAMSTGAQGSGILASMAHAEGLMVVPAESHGLLADTYVTVQLLDGMSYQAEIGGEW